MIFASDARRHGLLLLALVVGSIGSPARGQQETVLNTLHNLSSSGPGEVRALSEKQVCKFCHVPHNPVLPVPLWGHALSQAEYRTAKIRRNSAQRLDAPQPDGASRLCLSCHDGTVALGDVAGEREPIRMAGPQRLRPGNRGYLGLDLSGSHPISFVPEARREIEAANSSADAPAPDVDFSVLPLEALRASPDVRLDASGKMQCTTCHDPHSDRHYIEGEVPRFWVKPTVDEVCLGCHIAN